MKITHPIASLALILLLAGGTTSRSELTRKPYLQNVQKTSAVVMWESDVEGEGVVRYGTTLKMDHTAEARAVELEPSSRRTRVDNEWVDTEFAPPENAHVYEASLEGLPPGEVIYYQVEHAGGIVGRRHFRTIPTYSERFRFVAYGDNRTNVGVAETVAAQILKANPDFFLSTGDLVTRGQNYAEWTQQFFGPISDVIDHIPIWPSMGNHEGDGVNYHNLLNLPGEEDYYSFDYGNAHFVAINSIHSTATEMAKFLEKDLAASDAKWKFVYYHIPTYNAGGHRSRYGRTNLPELYARHHVDIVFNGHSHLYERTYPITAGDAGGGWPVTYIVTGGAGAGLYDLGDTEYIAKDAKVHHITIVDIDGDRLTGKAVDQTGEIIDTFEIDKSNGHTDEFLASSIDAAQINFADGLRSPIQRPVANFTAGEPIELEITFKNISIDEAAKVTIRPRANDFIDAIEPASLELTLAKDAEVTAKFSITPNISYRIGGGAEARVADAKTRARVSSDIDTGRLANLRNPPLMILEVEYKTAFGDGEFLGATLLLAPAPPKRP